MKRVCGVKAVLSVVIKIWGFIPFCQFYAINDL